MKIFPRFPNRGLMITFGIFLPFVLSAQRLSDIKVRYSGTTITKAKLKNVGTLPVDFYRHNFDLELGVGQGFVGLTYQYATKEKNTRKIANTFGRVEDGLMLTAGYNFVLSDHLRLDTYGRAGIWGETNYAQALYATDTDLQLNLVMFSPDGLALFGRHPVFHSLQAGANVNKFGRVQGLAGGGLWWNGFGLYLSAFQAFNGVVDPLHPGDDADKVFANLKNSGVSMGATYEYRGFLLWFKRNYAVMNGGNDLMLSLQYQRFFQKRRR
ncbi:MAG: hypothetical protein ACREOO_03200 [bacterium]